MTASTLPKRTVRMADLPPAADRSQALTGLSLDDILTIEPRLRAVRDLALISRHGAYPLDTFYQSIKPRLLKLVGWSAIEPCLRSSDCWDVLYQDCLALLHTRPPIIDKTEQKRLYARAWLRCALQLGQRPLPQLTQEWKTAGIPGTMIRQAAQSMVRVRRSGRDAGLTTWELRAGSEYEPLQFNTPLNRAFGVDLSACLQGASH